MKRRDGGPLLTGDLWRTLRTTSHRGVKSVLWRHIRAETTRHERTLAELLVASGGVTR